MLDQTALYCSVEFTIRLASSQSSGISNPVRESEDVDTSPALRLLLSSDAIPLLIDTISSTFEKDSCASLGVVEGGPLWRSGFR